MKLRFELTWKLWGGKRRGSSHIKTEWLLYIPPVLITKTACCPYTACVCPVSFLQLVFVTEAQCFVAVIFKELREKSRAGLRGEKGGQLPGTLRRHSNNLIYSTRKLNFQTRKNFSENYPQFGHAPSKTFVILALGRKCLKGRQIIGLPGAPTWHELALDKSSVSSIFRKSIVPSH